MPPPDEAFDARLLLEDGMAEVDEERVGPEGVGRVPPVWRRTVEEEDRDGVGRLCARFPAAPGVKPACRARRGGESEG